MLILGSGGAQPPPRPGCSCKVCEEARAKGIPYYRTGPSLYLPVQNILFDVPEEVRSQLNREGIGPVRHVFISHWHPDHTLGIRVFEQMNHNWTLKAPKKSILYISKETEDNIGNRLLPGIIPLYERRGIMEVRHVKEGETIEFGNLGVTPYRFPESDTFLYRLRQGRKVAIYAPCDVRNFPIKEELMRPDLLIIHLGYFKEIVPPEVDIAEDSFDDDLETLQKLGARRTIFMHIEELWGRSHDDYRRMQRKLTKYNVAFAYDGMMVQI